MTADRADVYDRITSTFIQALEEAKTPTEWPWVRAAQAGVPMNAATKRAYNGINRLLLGCAMHAGASRHWATFNQWKTLGATVKKGSKGTLVVYYGDLWVDETDKRVTPETPGARKIVYPKGSTVFSADQVEGWKAPAMPIAAEGAEHLEDVDAFVQATGAIVFERGDRAFYSPAADTITMPARGLFKDTAQASASVHFYGTLLHELVHWTGAKHRLAREFGSRFGNEAYAAEELVAEIGAAFLSADLGICPAPRADNVGYVASWLRVMKGDKRAIFTASTAATKASAFLHEAAMPAQAAA